MTKVKHATAWLGLRIDAALKAAFQAACARVGKDMTEVLIALIERWIAEQDESEATK